ncbi:hypothetical protein AMES_8710 [Amycolatopsis mediterranei S699]|uniref:Uncharacterized protein n=2 Tax=Amycolatopsis mediterranei TaxID=33910 RepID=A0A0H3DIN3_AMYMU|nr:hypothetical protein [Amycolatopsis mediterranei]ADJ50536.1 conserved hypothetical protein [Amycolatopsis mediterranei U32]AEK47542.1 hypothetical protein RAM_45385 [Amycolatopsis mediterranei S699]AFO82242.1 hypothetical protein AMES_8710 [Amycolatopsis mediterranei S699]AGT89371.1 hypothetical protein B737_8711 [Amycolatopsis mediterranei RB]KDO09279.1 hypothetical protein DV26_19065 [Amycolatopsis mediterranei]
MVEVHDGPPMDGFSVPLRLHNLLLALAGRIDDSALTEARELIARAHIDEAVELTTGTLIAGRIPVSSAEQRELALVLEMSRSDATLANDLLVDEAEPVNTHRFSGENSPEFGIAEALDRTLQVLPDVRSVHAVWRNTPAGSVPGALPQRVVLVELGPEGNPPAVAFRVDTALRRAGIHSVVEVSGPGVAHSEYHQAASAAASPAWVTGSTTSSSSSYRSEPAKPPAPVTPEPLSESGSRHSMRSGGTTTAPPEPVAPVVPIVSSPAPEPPRKARSETRAERTADLTPAEVAQLRQALAEDPEKGREIAAGKPSMHEVVELPALDLDDPSLSERDRALLRELHAELAERERAEAAKMRLNGASRSGGDQRGWTAP